jgi:hypothetical protein
MLKNWSVGRWSSGCRRLPLQTGTPSLALSEPIALQRMPTFNLSSVRVSIFKMRQAFFATQRHGLHMAVSLVF